MTPEEAVAHKAQEQFDEYEREIGALLAELAVRKRMRAHLEPRDGEIGALRAALAEYEQALARIAAPPTDRDGIGVTARAIATAALAARSEPDSVTHNPKPDWTVTHPRSTSCPWCSDNEGSAE